MQRNISMFSFATARNWDSCICNFYLCSALYDSQSHKQCVAFHLDKTKSCIQKEMCVHVHVLVKLAQHASQSHVLSAIAFPAKCTHPLHLGAEGAVANLQDAGDELVCNALLLHFQTDLHIACMQATSTALVYRKNSNLYLQA